MKFPPVSVVVVPALAWFSVEGPCAAEPVALKNGTSPDGRFEVVLEAEKGTPEYENYKMVGDSTEFPGFLLRDAKSHKVLKRIEWAGDPTGDAMPLAEKSKILWSPTSSAVAINTRERFYSYTVIWALNPKSGIFVEVATPSYEAMTGRKLPRQEDLAPRGHDRVVKWTADGKLVWRMHLTPAGNYQGDDPMSYRVTLAVSAKGMKVVSHEAVPREEQ